MADRRNHAPFRTDRPNDGQALLPTVREVLALDAFAAGVPEVLAGHDGLDVRVRWTHASDSVAVARLLDGGELLLTTGSGWPADAADLAGFVDALGDAGLSCLVVELGTRYREVPPAVVEAADRRGLALVALHREVKFVALTEAVHRRIIAEQTAALQARDDVRERFTALALRGSPADFIVHQLAQTLAAPVVLENLAHEVVVAEVPPDAEEELLTGWEASSRAAHRDRSAPPATDDWLIVPVEARGVRWGHLIALPGPPHPAGRASVLEQGAIALALGRLADGDADEWSAIGRRRLLDGLLAGRFAGADGAAARLEAAGLPVTGHRLYGLVATGAAVSDEAADAAARAIGGRALTGSAPAGSTHPATTILVSLPTRARFDDTVARRFGAALAPGADRLVLAVGTPGEWLEDGMTSIQEAIDLARGRSGRAESGVQVRRAESRPLMRLVTTLRDDHRLLEHGERMLAPLIEHDQSRDGDLLEVLGALLAHPGNRTAAATASHLSRSVFYQRLTLIQELLDVDLDDGETQTALHLALLVHRSAG